MRNAKDRLDRLEREAGEQLSTVQCDECRAWPSVCWVTIDDADGVATWGSDPPQECPRCGWVADLVTFHIVEDWRSVTPSSRMR